MIKELSQRSSRAAVTTMASNTGCTSEGELAMTFRMSAVAAWRCSASFSSRASRAASDLGLAFDERRGFAVLAVRFAAARRRAGAFLVPCFFFGELPFAEPRLMAGPHTALEVEYRL